MTLYGRVSAGFAAWTERRMQVKERHEKRGPWPFRRHPVRLIPGETVVLKAPHHWIAYSMPFLEFLGGLLILLGLVWFVPVSMLWLVVLIGLGICLHALYRMLVIYRDCFYVTNSRVLRESGVFSRSLATMPIGRVLDVAVELPYTLRPWRVGHLVIETAAQEQALRKIMLIHDPETCSNVIHQVRTGPPVPTPAPPPTSQPTAPARRRVADHPRLPGPRNARRPR